MLTLMTIPGLFLLAQGLPGLVWLAIAFFIIAIIAYLFGASGVAGLSAEVGRILLFIFLVLAVISIIIGLATRSA